MRKQRLALAGFASALLVAGCSEGGPGNKLVASPQGVYFTNWRGQVFRIEGEQLARVDVRPTPLSPRVVNVSQTIPQGSRSAFPVVVTGRLKAGDGMARVKLSVALGDNGTNKPTAKDQTAFISRLRSGAEKLRGLSLMLYDSDEFLAAPAMWIDLPGEHWTAVVNDTGVAERFEYNSRIELAGVKEGEIASAEVQWVTLD